MKGAKACSLDVNDEKALDEAVGKVDGKFLREWTDGCLTNEQ